MIHVYTLLRIILHTGFHRTPLLIRHTISFMDMHLKIQMIITGYGPLNFTHQCLLISKTILILIRLLLSTQLKMV